MTLTSNKTVLIVDDNEENRYILEVICKSLGYTTASVTNGQEAMDYLKSTLPILILLDLVMPVMDGFEVLKRVRENKKTQDLPVIMVSSIDETESVLKCLQKGADDYIAKPFEPDILKVRMENTLSKFLYIKMEKELLEKTFSGSMKVLSDILSSVSPSLFGKSLRTRRICKLIAEDLKLSDIWEIEISAMFSLIGCITLPAETITKIVEGKTLVAVEKIMNENHPYVGYKLLSHIPRLENVALNIFFQNKTRLTNSLPPEILSKVKEIPLAAKILYAANEYDFISTRSTIKADIITYLKKLDLDETLFSSLEKIVLIENGRVEKRIKLSDLQTGMIFASDLLTENNNKVASKWMEVSNSLLDVIKLVHSKVPIVEPVHVFVPKPA
jgi:CheY-like chemotaxis protein